MGAGHVFQSGEVGVSQVHNGHVLHHHTLELYRQVSVPSLCINVVSSPCRNIIKVNQICRGVELNVLCPGLYAESVHDAIVWFKDLEFCLLVCVPPAASIRPLGGLAGVLCCHLFFDDKIMPPRRC